MCRNTHSFMSMDGHGRRFNSLGDVLRALAEAHGEPQKPQTNAEFIAAAIEEAETKMRGLDAALTLLRSSPPEEGAELVALDIRAPADPKKHGIATVATYKLEGDSFLVIGKDHLTQEVVQHTTPNVHGVEGLQQAVIVELDKQAVAAAEAKASS